MALAKTEALVLKTFNWSESSRTVVFFGRACGKLALVDKAGRRLNSRRGRIIPFARLEITYYASEKETRGYISDVDLVESFELAGEGSLGRLAYASAGCELLRLLLPEEEPQAVLYDYFVHYLRHMNGAKRRCLPAVFVAFALRTVSDLGYHPSLEFCCGCGRPVAAEGDEGAGSNGGPLMFCAERGGVVCPTCQSPGDCYIPTTPERLRLLAALQRASLNEAAGVPLSYAEASELVELLTSFLKHQTGLRADLKSLEFLEKLKNTPLNE